MVRATRLLPGHEVAAAGLTGWALLPPALHTRLPLPDYATGLRLVAAVGAAAEQADHHPDLDLRYGALRVRLLSHDVGGVTQRDVDLARRITALAAAEGVVPQAADAVRVDLGLDTPDASAVRPFWAAVLAMRERRAPGDEPELEHDVLPGLWFQRSGAQEPRQRFHLDVWVPPEVVADRVAAAVAAGGVLVSDADAPAFWVLADAEGNRVCLCTWQDRDLA